MIWFLANRRSAESASVGAIEEIDLDCSTQPADSGHVAVVQKAMEFRYGTYRCCQRASAAAPGLACGFYHPTIYHPWLRARKQLTRAALSPALLCGHVLALIDTSSMTYARSGVPPVW